mmetsp:Transcript_19415/g.39900  ORF Transcript_19415/g.39900 Transcript_19415/m.39900 type:complete len:150 (-) Transcript_19415:100-549(-)
MLATRACYCRVSMFKWPFYCLSTRPLRTFLIAVEDDPAGENSVVIITLDKVKRTWWESVVKGDPEIDTTKVDSTCKLDEYDTETQGAIRKIMFDQKQKALGLPSSDQLTTDALLEKASLLPGSPFLLPGTPLAGGGGVLPTQRLASKGR